MFRSHRLALGLIILALVTPSGPARAGFAQAFEQVTIGGNTTFSVQTGTTNAVDQYSISSPDGSSGSGQARAGGTTSLDVGTFLGAAARANGFGVDSAAYATWKDTVYLDGAVPAGTIFRFNFHINVDALIIGTDTEDPTSFARAGAGLSAEAKTASQVDVTHSAVGSFDDPAGGVLDSGWDNFLSDMHLDVPLMSPNDGLAGINWTFELEAFAHAFNGEATSDAYNSAGLSSILISTPGGSGFVTPESMGLHLRFASGLTSPNPTVAAVPGPSGLVLVGSGMACVLAFGRRRWGRPGAKAIDVAIAE